MPVKDEVETEGLLRRRSNGQVDIENLPLDLLEKFEQDRPQKRLTGKIKTLIVVLTFLILVCLTILFRFSSQTEDDQREVQYDKSHGSNQLDQILHPEKHTSREATTQELSFLLSRGYREADGVRKRVYLVNDQFPGPTIEARSGDTLKIVVHNGLEDESASLHWHGLHMRDGQNNMDGAAGITQCPIPAGENFTYVFDIPKDQHGTFWYHAHDQVQRADGMLGGLVVHKPQSDLDVDEERLILIGDWYHRTANEVLGWYMKHSSFGNEPVPDSLLVNGKGFYDCSMSVPARPVQCTQIDNASKPTLHMDLSRKYRLRVVNVGSFAGISIKLAGFNLTVITVDGGNGVISEPASSIGILHPGERIDIIATALASTTESLGSFQIILDDTNFRYPNSALTKVQDFPLVISGLGKINPATPTIADYFSLKNLRGTTSDDHSILSVVADKVLVVYAASLKLAHLSNVPHGFMNKTTWQPQENPGLPLISLTRPEWDTHQLVPYIESSMSNPTLVDLVINGIDDGSHSFHLHGYDFYVLQTCEDGRRLVSYDPFDALNGPPCGPYNLIDPVRKDTVLVPRRGYVVIRLLASNPGIWFLHCHLLWHQASGMSMALQVGGNENWSAGFSNSVAQRVLAASMC